MEVPSQRARKFCCVCRKNKLRGCGTGEAIQNRGCQGALSSSADCARDSDPEQLERAIETVTRDMKREERETRCSMAYNEIEESTQPATIPIPRHDHEVRTDG